MVDLVLGDDHEIFLDALAASLPSRGFTVLATADSVAATVTRVRQHRPEICLLDRYFADGDGIEALSALTGTKILMLTADGDARSMRRALARGAAGYVHKMCGLGVLSTAIRAVARGEVPVELSAAPAPRPAGSDEMRRLAQYLTPRERECLRLIVEGQRTTSMANGLGVSRTTVRTHVQSVLTKLGVHSRLEAASCAMRHDLLDLPPG